MDIKHKIKTGLHTWYNLRNDEGKHFKKIE